MNALGGLNRTCGACGRIVGDHNLREWSACVGTVTTDLPFEATPPDLAEAAAANLRERLGVDEDVTIADHVVVRAITLGGSARELSITLPGLLHEFQIGVAGSAPTEVAKVLYLGDTAAIRGYGRLVRDSSNGAANAAERATR